MAHSFSNSPALMEMCWPWWRLQTVQSRGRRERQGHWPHLHNPILATHLTSSIPTHRQFFISLMIIYHNIQVKQDNPFKAAKNCNHFFLTSYISVWSNLTHTGTPRLGDGRPISARLWDCGHSLGRAGWVRMGGGRLGVGRASKQLPSPVGQLWNK